MIIDYAFYVLDLDRIYLNVFRINARAIEFYDKLRFSYTHSSYIPFQGQESELVWYEVLKK